MSQDPSFAAGAELIRHCSECLAIYRSEFTRCPVDGAHLVMSSVDPMLGVTVAEHYHIDEAIGIGSSGRVYLAHHSRLAQRRFALKILFGDLATTASARMRFTHEAESASRLAHPNLVSVVDFGRTPAGLLYLAMDYIEGPTLASVIAEAGPIPQDRAVRIALQLCRGLAHAHDLGLVHRDFKPDNILVSKDVHGDVPRIVDFGIALSADTEGDPRLTATGITLGTPAYAAPEQTSDDGVDHRADLFALGVTMYEMLTGKLPFEGTMVEIMRLNATTDAPLMQVRTPGIQVSASLQHVVSKLMARDPEQRYQTAREVLEALTELPRRPGMIGRPGSVVIPAEVTARASSTSIGATPPARQLLTPAGFSASSPSHPSLRPSSPSLSGRPSSPSLPGRPSSPSLGGRRSTPVSGVRPSAPALGARPSSLTLQARPSAPQLPMVLPSSTSSRPIAVPAVDATESRPFSRVDLPPLVTPVASRSWSGATLALAVTVAALVSATLVLGYQRMTASSPAAELPPGSRAPAPTPTSPARSVEAPAPAAPPPNSTTSVVEEGRPQDDASERAPATNTVVGTPAAASPSLPRRRSRDSGARPRAQRRTAASR
jgi:eukaryotic-like serine/threonine-protein kinase